MIKKKFPVSVAGKFIRSTTEKFDVIMLSIPVTKTSRSLEGYALTENFLFTTDSISDYLSHLTDNGRLIVVAHEDLEILRLVLTSLAALQEKGTGQALGTLLQIHSSTSPVIGTTTGRQTILSTTSG